MFDIYYESEDFKLDAPEDVVTSILEYGEKKLKLFSYSSPKMLIKRI